MDESCISIIVDDGLPGYNDDLDNELAPDALMNDDPRNAGVAGKVIGKDELNQIQKDISNTTRPRWQSGPPPKFGTKGAGKLKADQWRTCIEFDIPVSLVQMWGATQGDIDQDDRRRQLLHSTILLATAIRCATSYRTSATHAAKYTNNMVAYLRSLRALFPETDLRSNHHNSLYIGEFLLIFGPLPGWWMFPFERIIGMLQQINTNQIMGTWRQGYHITPIC